MDVNIRIPAFEKLVDYAASGIGSVAGSMLAPWKARREATAGLIAAQGKTEELKLEAKAQAEAHRILVSPDTHTEREIKIGEKIKQRIQFQEEKRQRNIKRVVCLAADKLGDREVPNHEPDHDWTARFFNDVKDISSKEMQSLWAKILAGQVERSRSTSIRTLSILRNLDQATAELFKKLCSACISTGYGSEDQYHFLDTRVPSLGGNPNLNALKKYGFSYDNLNILNEYGLIISDYNSRYNYGSYVGTPCTRPFWFNYIGREWILLVASENAIPKEFWLDGVALTRSGRELFSVVDIDTIDQYTQDLKKFFEGKNMKMTERSGP